MSEYLVARAKMAERVAEFKKITNERRRKLHENVCSKCDYWADNCCYYIVIEKKPRPCVGTKCVETGVFKKATGKKSKTGGWY